MAETLQNLLNSIVSATAGLPEPEVLARWSPALSGDIDICIRADGSWTHEGSPINREGIVRVFASLLRRENDGDYYLVTPAEKWRIRVERHALVGIDCECVEDSWQLLLNTGGRCSIGGDQRLHVAGDAGEPFVELPNGLSAQITRAAWYRLMDAAVITDDRAYILSAGEEIFLGSTH
ncbi:DUF1285 domain-containing protein [Congregibacter sp.]|uniref:DUF1285 domain-containing protein n=1 Tax=Congregibacter sp. TaxID=2744308 RepID=UPI003F6B0913